MIYTVQKIIDKRQELWALNLDESRNTAEKEDITYTESVADFLMKEKDLRAISLRDQIQKFPDNLIEMVFSVVDKHQHRVPFILNEVQANFRDTLNQARVDYYAGKRHSLKFLVLKGRQQGFTTFITAYQLASIITQKNFFGFTLADDGENSLTIFQQKAKVPYNYLPEILKPQEKYNSKKEFYFDKLNSAWKTATAGAGRVGHSKTLNFFHGSEAAFWVDMSTIMGGLGEALTADAIQILESTANGFNEYRDLWVDDNNWQCCFFEWWLTSEYKRPLAPNEAEDFKSHIENALGDAESIFKVETDEWIWHRCKWLRDTIGLNYEQIHWYYLKWKDRKKLLCQEYPCTDLEAFLASGNCIFETPKLVARHDILKRFYKDHPFRRGHFIVEWQYPSEEEIVARGKIVNYKWEDKADGVITLFGEWTNIDNQNGQRIFHPLLGHPYVIGGDTSGEGKDRFSCTVKNNHTGMRVAQIWGDRSMDEEQYTQQIYCLGKTFNHAFVGIEINFNTYPITRLKMLGYGHQYVRRVYDDISGSYQKKFGWRTDGNNRPAIITRFQTLVKENIDKFFSLDCIDECLTFVDNGERFDHQSGKHDDILFSDMICEEISINCSHAIRQVIKPPTKKLIEKLGIRKQRRLRR